MVITSRFHYFRWFFIALILMASKQSLAAEVSASLDRDQIVEGETVTLILQTTDPRQSLEVDTQLLEKDFQIIDSRTETQMSIVNGRQTARVRQLFVLEPRKTGQLQVPSLPLKGGALTPSLALQVEPAPQLAPGEPEPVFLEVQLEPEQGPFYVHAQISLKVRIFYQQNLTEAAINAPQPDQASVRLLDEVPYQSERNGIRYRVLERHYAVFPERSGELLLPPLQLSGRLIERPADRLWQPSVRGRRVRIESEPLTINVLPRPASFSGDRWLPARSIQLAQQITDGETISVGEPVTRTVIVDAVGLEEHMLEEPDWPQVESARIYPDQPQGISRDDGQWVLGHREFRYAVVPEQAGTLVLPEIRLPWWDTVNNRERVALLPEHRVEVLPSQLPDPASAQTDLATANPVRASGAARSDTESIWRWVSLALLLLWLATLWLYLQDRRSPDSPEALSGLSDPEEQLIVGALRKACRTDDQREAHRQLSAWVRHFGPASAHGSVLGLAQYCDRPDLDSAIRELDSSGFRGGASDWNGQALQKAFDDWLKKWRSGESKASASDQSLNLYAAARGA